MDGVKREYLIAYHDLLEGCKTLIRSEVPDIEQADEFLPLIDYTLQNFFSAHKVDIRTVIVNRYGTAQDTAHEVLNFLTTELYRRIQRSFGVIYPNHEYNYTFCDKTGHLTVGEFPPRVVIDEYILDQDPSHDDAWIPERQRR